MTDVATPAAAFDFEAVFRAQYSFVARVISRIVQDPERAQELAAEVFWKLSQTPNAQAGSTPGWLYRTATRMALDDLRKQLRRKKYEQFFSFGRAVRTPEEIHLESEERFRVQTVLAKLKESQAQLLILRSNDLTYEEIAEALGVNLTSIGTLLRRAEEAFRKAFVKKYGPHE
jgi:RNA polymerase sigma-70 factor (ECF subfamily)